MAQYLSAVDLSVIVPLPAAVADNKAAAFARLAGEAPLARVVRSALGQRRRIVVAAAKPLADEVRECLVAHELRSVAVAEIEGSASRRECVEAALEHLGGESIPTPLVLIHDHRYPLVPSGVCDRVIERLRGGSPVVFPALPLTDSVKAIDSAGRIIESVDRSTLRTVQYPRGFSWDRLSSLAAACPTDDFDEVEEAIRAGLMITTVDGDPDAFVVDLPRDGQLIEAIISTRQADPAEQQVFGDEHIAGVGHFEVARMAAERMDLDIGEPLNTR